MKMLRKNYIAAVSLLITSVTVEAAEINLTASFSPSISSPENNTFTNTTPISGYCLLSQSNCSSDEFSIIIPLASTNISPVNNGDSVSFAIPSANRMIRVTNENGDEHILNFRVSGFGASYQSFYLPGSSDTEDRNLWSGGNFANAPSPCISGKISSWYWETGVYVFFWGAPSQNVICTKTSKADRGDNLYRIYNANIMYTLQTPNPLQMNSGIYTGSYTYSVGTGMDFDFGGSKFSNSDSSLTFNFILSVNHELKVAMNTEELNVALQPCDVMKICSEEQGKANWERWMLTRATPVLTGRSRFSISSSGSFTAYLQCEYEIDANCGLKSENSSQLVPVHTMLTLPENIVDAETGITVNKTPLNIGKQLSRNVFQTLSFGQNRLGNIDFEVKQRDVDTMLTTRPDTYRGAVTVIFDSVIY
ncbi:hypothetical protein [Enterobacter huaxiensis]|uniref:hypothetical protein n=1 Tax=Enterobacter huaxiensis TaxID=2494702 RepID=UPI0021DA2F14|nr:hypothetical protein [Enterobacter huaxiensis]